MSEGETPGPDGPPGGTSEQDETVAFVAETDLPEPLPAPTPAASPTPPPPDQEGIATVAEGSSPWRARPATPAARSTVGTPSPGGPDGPVGPTGPGGPSGPGRRSSGSSWNALTVVAVGGVVVLVVVIVLMAVVLGFGGDDDGEDVVASDTTTTAPATTEATTTASTSTTTTPTTTAPPETAPPTTTPLPPVTIIVGGDDLVHGLFCRDLLAQGADYDEAVVYWLQEGRPSHMDEDANGIPCETIYPAADVEAVWGPQGLEEEGIAPGLFCRDLVAQGLDYGASVAYWIDEGQPARMDDDGNGRPCETVYPAEEVEAYWA